MVTLENWLKIENIYCLIQKAKMHIHDAEQKVVVAKIEKAFLADEDAVEFRILELLDDLRG